MLRKMVSQFKIFKRAQILAVFLATVLVVVSGGLARADERLRASQLEISGGRSDTTVSMTFDQDPQLRWFGLSAPYRLVLELPATSFAFEPAALRGGGLVSMVRIGDVRAGRSRIILSSKLPFAVESTDVTAVGREHRLEIKLKSATADEFSAMQAEHDPATAAISASATTPDNAKRFTIVIDPGHGGADGGAESPSGTVEKDITLAFGKELFAELSKNSQFDVQLTRDDDHFIRLDDRVAIARERKADLFISIHADTIRAHGLRGATVYTGSDRASDADAEALADRENLSDRAGGEISAAVEPEVSDILNDMMRRETREFSVNVAKLLVGRLAQSVGVIKNPHRQARFRVLTAPDVPSVLIELGYLSNELDENSLIDPIWRAKAAASIASAVTEFASARSLNASAAE